MSLFLTGTPSLNCRTLLPHYMAAPSFLKLIWLEPTIKSLSLLRTFLRPPLPHPLDFLTSYRCPWLEECGPVLPVVYGPLSLRSTLCVFLFGRHFDCQPQQMCPGCNFTQLPWFPRGQPGHLPYGGQSTTHPGLSPASHTV